MADKGNSWSVYNAVGQSNQLLTQMGLSHLMVASVHRSCEQNPGVPMEWEAATPQKETFFELRAVHTRLEEQNGKLGCRG